MNAPSSCTAEHAGVLLRSPFYEAREIRKARWTAAGCCGSYERNESGRVGILCMAVEQRPLKAKALVLAI